MAVMALETLRIEALVATNPGEYLPTLVGAGSFVDALVTPVDELDTTSYVEWKGASAVEGGLGPDASYFADPSIPLNDWPLESAVFTAVTLRVLYRCWPSAGQTDCYPKMGVLADDGVGEESFYLVPQYQPFAQSTDLVIGEYVHPDPHSLAIDNPYKWPYNLFPRIRAGVTGPGSEWTKTSYLRIYGCELIIQYVHTPAKEPVEIIRIESTIEGTPKASSLIAETVKAESLITDTPKAKSTTGMVIKIDSLIE